MDVFSGSSDLTSLVRAEVAYLDLSYPQTAFYKVSAIANINFVFPFTININEKKTDVYKLTGLCDISNEKQVHNELMASIYKTTRQTKCLKFQRVFRCMLAPLIFRNKRSESLNWIINRSINSPLSLWMKTSCECSVVLMKSNLLFY